MLLKEIGFEYLLEKVFLVNHCTPTSIAQYEHFELSGDDLKVKLSAFDKIREYIASNPKPINETSLILGIMSTFAYSHPDENMKNDAMRFIQIHFDGIIYNLERIVPELESTFQKKSIGFYKHIILMPFSYELMEIASHPNNFPWLVHDRNNYGIKYLLGYMAMVNFKKFDKWFCTSPRDDLKMLFIAYLYDPVYSGSHVSYQFMESKNPLLRVTGIFNALPISKFMPVHGRSVDIKDILSLPITDKEKAYVTLYYFIKEYGAKGFDELDVDDKLKKDLGVIGQCNHMNNLDDSLLRDSHLQEYNYEIARRLIEVLSDNNQKNELMRYLLHNILDNLHDEYIGTHDLMSANVLGRAMISIDSDITDEIVGLFDKMYKEIYQPYFHIRRYTTWSIGVSKLMFYLIALFVKYSNDGKFEELTAYVKKYKTVKDGHSHHMNNDLESFLGQIEEYIVSASPSQ